MATVQRIRYTPDVYTDRALMGNASPDGSSGTLYFPIQVIVYDDTLVTAANYKAGHPDTEMLVTIVLNDVIQGDLAVLSALGGAAQVSWLNKQLDDYATSHQALLDTTSPIRYRAAQIKPRPVP